MRDMSARLPSIWNARACDIPSLCVRAYVGVREESGQRGLGSLTADRVQYLAAVLLLALLVVSRCV